MNAKESIKDLEAYLVDKYDIFVEFAYGEPNGYSTGERVITINKKQSFQTRLYTLLHEAGHFLLYSEAGFQDRFPHIIYQPFKKRITQANSIDVVRNEVLAWERGRELAEKLVIEVDEKKWANLRKKCLHDYFKWAVRGRA